MAFCPLCQSSNSRYHDFTSAFIFTLGARNVFLFYFGGLAVACSSLGR